jgi:ABC-type Mn2+/Zn2+ transport system permease subunit
MVFGSLVLPPVTAMLLVRRVKAIFLLAALIGAVTPVAGLLLAFRYDLPSSPAIVAVLFAVLAVAWLVSLVRAR